MVNAATSHDFQPVPSTLILDELTAAAVYKDVQPVIVITKADLAAADALEKAYADSTIPLIRLDYDTGEGLDQIRARIAGNLCAFCGNSGVGKSTLLNRLCPDLALETGETSKKLGRGRHTTRHCELYPVAGGWVADTPGFSALELERDAEIDKDELPGCFPDFRPYLGDCRFNSCTHVADKGCAVCAAVERGEISESRHNSYVEFYNQVKDIKKWERK